MAKTRFNGGHHDPCIPGKWPIDPDNPSSAGPVCCGIYPAECAHSLICCGYVIWFNWLVVIHLSKFWALLHWHGDNCTSAMQCNDPAGAAGVRWTSTKKNTKHELCISLRMYCICMIWESNMVTMAPADMLNATDKVICWFKDEYMKTHFLTI